MKKKYINYLLFALVLSLCIFYFSRNLDGFQTSPIDFTNFSGTLTGIRVALIDPSKEGPTIPDIIKGLLGDNLTDTDMMIMAELPNGDLITPYFYINPTGHSSSSSENDDPYKLSVIPEILTFIKMKKQFTPEDFHEILKKMLLTLNFSRNHKIPLIVLTNRNINHIYNNIYANLYKKNVRLVSLILNKTMDYPPVDYSQYNSPITTSTPKVDINLNTRFSSITVKMSLLDIIKTFGTQIREFLSYTFIGSQLRITLIKSDQTREILNITLETSGGTPSTNTQSILVGNIQPTSEIKVYKLDFLNAFFLFSENRDLYKLSSFDPSGRYSYRHSEMRHKFMFENSSKIPDSVIQNYISPILLAFKLEFINLFKGTEGGIIPFSPDQLLTVNLSNPPQEIKVDIGTEMSVNNTPPSSILDQVRKILCI
jgi:hypothetical protein